MRRKQAENDPLMADEMGVASYVPKAGQQTNLRRTCGWDYEATERCEKVATHTVVSTRTIVRSPEPGSQIPVEAEETEHLCDFHTGEASIMYPWTVVVTRGVRLSK